MGSNRIDSAACIHRRGSIPSASVNVYFDKMSKDSRPARFVVRFVEIEREGYPASRKTMRDAITYLFSPLYIDDYSSAYREARKRLLESIDDPERRQVCDDMKISIIADGDFNDPTFTLSFLQYLSSVRIEQRSQQPCKRMRCPLSLDGMSLNVELIPTAEDEAITLSKELTRRTLPLFEVRVNDSKHTARVLRGALLVNSGTQCQVDKVHLNGSFQDEHMRIALFSLFAATKSLKSLAIDMFGGSDGSDCTVVQRLVLQWLAFSLFSEFSSCSVEEFHLSASSLSQLNVSSMAEILQAANPLQIPLQSSHPGCRMAILADTVQIEDGEATQIDAGTVGWIVHDRLEDIEVSVLLPGYGVYPYQETC